MRMLEHPPASRLEVQSPRSSRGPARRAVPRPSGRSSAPRQQDRAAEEVVDHGQLAPGRGTRGFPGSPTLVSKRVQRGDPSPAARLDFGLGQVVGQVRTPAATPGPAPGSGTECSSSSQASAPAPRRNWRSWTPANHQADQRQWRRRSLLQVGHGRPSDRNHATRRRRRPADGALPTSGSPRRRCRGSAASSPRCRQAAGGGECRRRTLAPIQSPTSSSTV